MGRHSTETPFRFRVAARLPVVLSIAASDPTGGAGLQADTVAIAALGCHPASAVSALTEQDTHGVYALRAVEPPWLEAQVRRVLADMPVSAIKLGVLGSAENAACLARILDAHAALPVITDPVLASGRGDPLADEPTREALCREILPRTWVATPNSREARSLAGEAGASLEACAAKILAFGCRYVLLTGTHEPGEQVVNTLYGANGKIRADAWPRLKGEYHGSGCTLAAALAAYLARGLALPEAVHAAQAYTWRALAAGYAAGRGQLIPHRFAAVADR